MVLSKNEMIILKKLHDLDSKVTLRELVGKCKLKKHEVMKCLNSLYDKGLIDKDVDEYYWITNPGKRVYNRHVKSVLETPSYADDILFLLAKSEGGMQRIELARALNVSPSNLTYALNYLLEKEYITQSEHERGKKEPYFITDAGLKKLKRELPHSSFVKRV
jgi:DNA-binding MarR family transcriptional regulator